MLLTDDEIKRIGEGNTGSWQDDLQFARAIESAVLAKLESLGDSDYESLANCDPHVAELEAVLRECREALVPYMKYVDGTNVLNHPAQCVAKIDAVLPKTLG